MIFQLSPNVIEDFLCGTKKSFVSFVFEDWSYFTNEILWCIRFERSLENMPENFLGNMSVYYIRTDHR